MALQEFHVDNSPGGTAGLLASSPASAHRDGDVLVFSEFSQSLRFLSVLLGGQPEPAVSLLWSSGLR